MPLPKLTALHFFKPALALLAIFLYTNTCSQYITTFGGNGTNSNIWADNGTAALCTGTLYPKGVCMDANNIYFTVSNAVRSISLGDGKIHNIAGSDNYGHTGDGGQAINAQLQSTYDVCRDANNNLYVTEAGGHYIRKIDGSTGIISTIAGTGTGGYSGDGGPATAAMINKPQGIYCDAAGNIYFADTYNSRVRKINVTTGIITTVAGTGSNTYSGDGGPATNAGTPYPVDVSIDGAGNVYFIEVFVSNTSRVRKIQASTGIVTTVAGRSNYAYSGDGGLATAADLFDPCGLYVDGPGNIYISTFDDSRIRKMDVNTGIINTIAGTGTNSYSGDGWKAAIATMNNPMGLTVAPNGDIYVADNQNHRIRKISLAITPPPFITIANTQISILPGNLCPGSPVSFGFTSTVSGPQNPFLTRREWMINGVVVSTAPGLFTTTALQSGDIVTCLQYYMVCGSEFAILSNAITFAFGGGTPPTINITASKNPICPGENPTFTAFAQNAGIIPSYQWQLNGVNAGTNSGTFSPTGLIDGDKITCTVTSDPASCSAGMSTGSNTITMIVLLTNVLPSVSVSASANDICPGIPVTFTATVQDNAGIAPAYEWKVNGQAAGINGPVFTPGNLVDNDEVICEISFITNSCGNTNIASVPVIMNIKQAATITLTPADTLVNYNTQLQLSATLSPAGSSFQWTPSALLTNPGSLNPVTIPLTTDTEFTLSAMSVEGCPAEKKAIVRIIYPLYMPTAFTPNGDALNDVYRIPPGVQLSLKDFSVYDRWGNRVFHTTDLSKGWDGKLKGIKQDSGVYVFVVAGSDAKGPVFVKGTFTLIR